MDPYSSSSSSSFDSCSFSAKQLKSSTTAPKNFHPTKKPTSVEAFLHSVRNKNLTNYKPWRKPIPPPPRMYRVHPANFRDLVQKLTGKPQFPASRRLQTAVPPPLKTVTMSLSQQGFSSSDHSNAVVSEPGSEVFNINPSFAMASPTYWCPNWCSTTPLLMSPGTLASLEQSTVL